MVMKCSCTAFDNSDNVCIIKTIIVLSKGLYLMLMPQTGIGYVDTKFTLIVDPDIHIFTKTGTNFVLKMVKSSNCYWGSLSSMETR